jgi:hypothetical protein
MNDLIAGFWMFLICAAEVVGSLGFAIVVAAFLIGGGRSRP